MESEQKQISELVDEMFKRSDKAAFEIMHRIAALALEQYSTPVEGIDK